jgi:hypothetical protein
VVCYERKYSAFKFYNLHKYKSGKTYFWMIFFYFKIDAKGKVKSIDQRQGKFTKQRNVNCRIFDEGRCVLCLQRFAVQTVQTERVGR